MAHCRSGSSKVLAFGHRILFLAMLTRIEKVTSELRIRPIRFSLCKFERKLVLVEGWRGIRSAKLSSSGVRIPPDVNDIEGDIRRRWGGLTPRICCCGEIFKIIQYFRIASSVPRSWETAGQDGN